MVKIQITRTRNITNYLFWLLLLQGISFIVLGIAVWFYPQILFALVAATFIWIGLTTILMAWKVRRFWHYIPDLF